MNAFLKLICTLCATCSLVIAKDGILLESKNAQNIQVEGIITHISTFANQIFVGNAGGGIDIFTIDTNKMAHKTSSLTLAPIKDYFGNTFAPRVFDITTFDGKTLFVLSEASHGGKQILKLSPKQKPEVIFHTPSSPKRIIALNDDKLVVGFLSNEVGIFDITHGKFEFITHPSQAGFSDLCLNAPFIFSTDESGIVHVISLANGEILKRLDKINKDNNYQIVSQKSTILTASVDRQMGIYTFEVSQDSNFELKSATSIKSEFLIYAVGISPQAKLAAFSKNEQNDISIIDLQTLQEKYTLQGSTSLINSIIFYDETTLISGSDDKNFIIWQLKE